MKEALYTKKTESGLQCVLCPHNCTIKPDKYGICNVRKNNGQKLITEVYNKVSALNIDPIEKKPLYHFYPGTNILSIGSVGCNLKCKFCQNWEISQTSSEKYQQNNNYTVDKIVNLAKKNINNIGIAYTYNEPTIWFEFMLETAQKAYEYSMKNVMVTNGYINPEPLQELLNYINAFSVDLKAFKDKFYKIQTLSNIEPVKSTIKTIAKSDRFLEITNLVIPELNDNKDDFSEMIKWIKNECGVDTVLHISRYFPKYKMSIESTPEKTLLDLYDVAIKELNYVYLGNVNSAKGQNTYCPNCRHVVIERYSYTIKTSGLNASGNCENCGQHVIKHIKSIVFDKQ